MLLAILGLFRLSFARKTHPGVTGAIDVVLVLVAGFLALPGTLETAFRVIERVVPFHWWWWLL